MLLEAVRATLEVDSTERISSGSMETKTSSREVGGVPITLLERHGSDMTNSNTHTIKLVSCLRLAYLLCKPMVLNLFKPADR